MIFPIKYNIYNKEKTNNHEKKRFTLRLYLAKKKKKKKKKTKTNKLKTGLVEVHTQKRSLTKYFRPTTFFKSLYSVPLIASQTNE